jgi:hypothetical protein
LKKPLPHDESHHGWDWVTIILALVIAIVLAMFTLELWAPHTLQLGR